MTSEREPRGKRGILATIWDNLKQLVRENWGIVWPIGAVVLLGATIAVLANWRATRQHDRESMNDPGRLEHAGLVSLEHGGHVVIIGASVTHATTSKSGAAGSFDTARLDSIDTSDGHRRARVLVDDLLQCVEASPGLAWCTAGSSSAPTLRDASTLALQGLDRLPASLDRSPTFAPRQPPLTDSIIARGGEYSFEGHPRATLAIDTGGEDSQTRFRPIAPANKYLSPHFLGVEHQPMKLADDKVVLVASDDSVDHDTAKLVISAITLDGAQRWTATFDDGPVVEAWLVDGHLVIAMGNYKKLGAVVAIDPANGHVLWRAGA